MRKEGTFFSDRGANEAVEHICSRSTSSAVSQRTNITAKRPSVSRERSKAIVYSRQRRRDGWEGPGISV